MLVGSRAWVGILVVAIGAAGCMSPVPAAPAGVTARPGDQRVGLSWLPNHEFDLKGYNVYWGDTANALTETTAITQPLNAASIANLTNGRAYYFAVDAENLLGQRSERSQVVSATPGSGGIDALAPYIQGTVPQSGMINVSLSQELKVEFNEPMNPGSVQLIVQPALALGNPEWLSGNRMVRFPNKAPFLKATLYRIVVEGQDLDGTPLGGTRNFQFSTENTDETPPMVAETSPAQGATNVSNCAPIAIRFSEPMQPGTLGFPIVISPDFSWDEVWNANFTVLYIVPNEPLAYGTQYTFTISHLAMDVAGNPFGTPYFGTFTTEAAPDRTLPQVVYQSPAGGTVASSNPPPIVLRFSEPMDTVYTQNTFDVYSYGTKVPGIRSWNLSGTELTFQALSPYIPGEPVTILMDYRDLAGNTSVGYVSQFLAP